MAIKDKDIALGSLLNEHDVARITGLSVATMRRWRLLREGPKYLKIGAAVRYRPEDVAAWLASRPTGGGQQQKGELQLKAPNCVTLGGRL